MHLTNFSPFWTKETTSVSFSVYQSLLKMFYLKGNNLLRRGAAFAPTDCKFLPFRVCCVAVLRPIQPNWVRSIAVSLPNHTLTGQA